MHLEESSKKYIVSARLHAGVRKKMKRNSGTFVISIFNYFTIVAGQGLGGGSKGSFSSLIYTEYK